ncbi:MAG: hypothetical protein HYY93_07270 [Planctomycetes bacterium]|nr:hypothetical protein [Planctomycetota bacterium]
MLPLRIGPPVAATPSGIVEGWPELSTLFNASESRSAPNSPTSDAAQLVGPPAAGVGERARFVPLAGRLLLAAAERLLARDRAAIDAAPPERRAIALAIGSAVFDAWAESLDALDAHPLGSPGLFPFTLPNVSTTLVARVLQIRGPSSTLSTCGPSASLDALAQASAWLALGDADLVCVGAVTTGGSAATGRFSEDWPVVPEGRRRPLAVLALAHPAGAEGGTPPGSRTLSALARIRSPGPPDPVDPAPGEEMRVWRILSGAPEANPVVLNPDYS